MERIIYFTVGSEPGTTEAAHFTTDTPAEELKELFRAAGEAGPKDILKLYTPAGRLVNIAPNLAANTPDSPYRLQVVGTQCNGMLLDEVGIDLLALEQRVARLEKQIRVDFDELPPIVQELKSQVDRFRSKLETTEHLSWLGFYKQLPPPLSSEECRRLQYRRKSEEEKRRVREKFYSICDVAVSEEVRLYLRQPTFDCHQWEDEEILLLLQQMYLDLELTSKFGIELPVLRAFLYEVYKNYNEVPFHNFRHCFCVAQMMYSIVWCVDLPSKIGDLETLILLTSCICHDLDHPGYNNIYQINAKTELALRYNDISPLENHHCSVAFRVLEEDDCNIFRSLPSETFRQVREGVIRCILATDMARHNEILAQFKEITPEFDFNNKAHTNLLSMVLIKVADISNEARPMDVAEPWLDRLLQEFFKQSDAEKLEGLPVTPFMDREKITKPSSQCSFIGLVLLPLFEALGELFTELQDLIVQPVRDALDHYRRLNEAAKDERMHRKSVIEISDSTGGGGDGSSAVVKSSSAHSVKSRRSLGASSRSRSAEEEDDSAAPPGLEGIGREFSIAEDEEHVDGISDGMQEGQQDEETFDEHRDEDEEEEEETVTEVEVSEKTLKFKISTEGSVTTPTGRKSYPGSRKGSREKSQMLPDYHQHELARAIRDHHYRNNYDGSGGSVHESSSTAGTTPTSPPPRSRDRPSPSTSIVSPSQPSKDRFVPLYHRNSLSANFMPSSHSSFMNTRHVTARELCNGETKCFDDAPGSVKYTTDEERKLSDGSQKDEGKKGAGSSENSKEETEENEPIDEVRIAATNPKKSTLLSRLRNFTDKLSFNSSSRELEESTSSAELPLSASPMHCNKFEMQDIDCQHNISRSSSSNKAMTLPKTRKPQRRNNASGGRRGWRSLIASSSKGDSPPSSSSLPDSSSPSTRRQLGCKNKRNSLCNAPEREDVHAKNGPSPTRDVLQDQDKDDDSSLPPQPSSAPPTTRKEKRQSGGLSGSLDSIVKVQEGSSGNNKNQKKGWSSPGGRRGLLAKLGRSSTHTEGTCSPRQDEDDSKTHNWITSLAANFRSKRNHQHQTISSKKPPSPPCQLPPTAQMPQK